MRVRNWSTLKGCRSDCSALAPRRTAARHVESAKYSYSISQDAPLPYSRYFIRERATSGLMHRDKKHLYSTTSSARAERWS